MKILTAYCSLLQLKVYSYQDANKDVCWFSCRSLSESRQKKIILRLKRSEGC